MALRTGIKQERSNWRARLREECQRAAQQQRQATLERYRSSLSPGQLKNVLETDMRQAVRQEVERQALSQGGHSVTLSARLPSVMLLHWHLFAMVCMHAWLAVGSFGIMDV